MKRDCSVPLALPVPCITQDFVARALAEPVAHFFSDLLKGGTDEDQLESMDTPASAVGDDSCRRLRTGVPQLFRLLRRVQILHTASATPCAL